MRVLVSTIWSQILTFLTVKRRVLGFILAFLLIPVITCAHTMADQLDLPEPGTMLDVSRKYQPPMLQGLTLDPSNPLQIDFLVNQGDTKIDPDGLSRDTEKLVKYFLTSLTVPEDKLWVNLSPYEADRIIPTEFGQTDMGRELLAQDYLLKQLSASMIYPEKDLGQKFWKRVHDLARSKFGTADIPMNTFNKIWIVPQEAVIHRQGHTVMIIKSRMKVLLEEDYVALKEHSLSGVVDTSHTSVTTGISSDIVREVIIPEIEREVNEGENFAELRQIYHSLILAVWYKQHLQDSVLGQLYVDQNKTAGVRQPDVQTNQRIYERYVSAFEKGVYNYIREDIDPMTDERMPRKYFSGGVDYAQLSSAISQSDQALLTESLQSLRRVRTRLDGLGDQASELRLLARGEDSQDQAILTQRLFDEAQLRAFTSFWSQLTDGSFPVDRETAQDIEFALNGRADENTKFYAVSGNWMRMLDRAEEVLSIYAPNRQIDLEKPSNMFLLTLENIFQGFDHMFNEDHVGILIIRVTEHANQRYRFDTVLMDGRGDFFLDTESGARISMDRAFAGNRLPDGPSIRIEDLAQAVNATDRFGVLSVQRELSDSPKGRYWESQHYRFRSVTLDERRLNDSPVQEGTAFIMSFFMGVDAHGKLYRDREAADAAVLAEEELPFNTGIQQLAGWLGHAMRDKKSNEPVVIVLHGRHGAGKTVTKNLIVDALTSEFGFRLDPERRKNGSKSIHRYNAWRTEDKLEEAWRSGFYGHAGIIIVETVETPVPDNWRDSDNLLFVHLRAEETRRRKRIERKGAQWSDQVEIISVHEEESDLATFRNLLRIENSSIDINKGFNGTMRFQNSYETALGDQALLSSQPQVSETRSNSAVNVTEKVGGIDLNPANLNLQTRGDISALDFSIDPTLLHGISTEGFVPVILNITPVTTLPLLSEKDSAPPSVDAAESPISTKISRR